MGQNHAIPGLAQRFSYYIILYVRACTSGKNNSNNKILLLCCNNTIFMQMQIFCNVQIDCNCETHIRTRHVKTIKLHFTDVAY